MFAHLKIMELKPKGISMLYSAKTMTSIKMKHITCTVQDHNHITGKLHKKNPISHLPTRDSIAE